MGNPTSTKLADTSASAAGYPNASGGFANAVAKGGGEFARGRLPRGDPDDVLFAAHLQASRFGFLGALGRGTGAVVDEGIWPAGDHGGAAAIEFPRGQSERDGVFARGEVVDRAR